MITIQEAPALAQNNRNTLPYHISCYYCQQHTTHPQITTYTTNNTALCPNCGVDALIPKTNKRLLTKIHKHWFNYK